MSDINAVQELNEQLARRIHAETQKDPNSPYANKYIGIANGQVVVISDDLYETYRYLRESEADPRTCFCIWIDPSLHYGAADEIWRLC